MSTLFLSKPNEILAGSKSSGLTKHDDVMAEQIKDTWWRAHNMDKIKAREKKVQDTKDRSSGAFTAICDWLMVVGEVVRDKASWRKATIIEIDNIKQSTRKIRYEDNGAEMILEVYQLEIFEQNNDLALVFRDWFHNRSIRSIELPPIRQNGEEALKLILNNLWEEQCEVSPPREMSPLEIGFLSQRLTLGTINGILTDIGINLDHCNAVTHLQFAFEIAGHSELPRTLSKLNMHDDDVENDDSTNDGGGDKSPWGISSAKCVPLWWDSNSNNLRNIQAVLRYHYHTQYAHWSGTNLLGLNKGIKDDDNAAVLYLVYCNREGPPEFRDSKDRINQLQFDITPQNMTTLLQAAELVNLPMNGIMHLHSSGFSWQPPNMSNDVRGEGEEGEGYYRHDVGPSNDDISLQSLEKNRNLIIEKCCVRKPIVCWKREIEENIQMEKKKKKEQQQQDDEFSRQNEQDVEYQDNRIGNEFERYENESGRSFDDSSSAHSQQNSYYQNQSTRYLMNEQEDQQQGQGQVSSSLSLIDSLKQSRQLEVELSEERKHGYSVALLEHNQKSNFLLTNQQNNSQYSSSSSQNGMINHQSSLRTSTGGGEAARLRNEADGYSVVLKNTTRSLTNASLWSDEFKETTTKPLNHHVLSEPHTMYHPTQDAFSQSQESHEGGGGYDDEKGRQSVRPRTVTPRNKGSRGGSRGQSQGIVLDTPGQQARMALAASKSKIPKLSKSSTSEKSGGNNESRNSSLSGSNRQDRKMKKMSAMEAEASGYRMSYTPIASKWAGPIAGKEKGYGTYEIKSTTRRVIDGEFPTEDHGTWKLPNYNNKEDYEFHAPPPPRPPWLTKAKRLSNANDIPEKPNPYPKYKMNEKVRAKSIDQPNAWFDAHIIKIIPSLTGHDAETKYDVRYEGYKNQPSRSSIGKSLPVEMIKGASSMLQCER
mmetsp:Transcript_113/g.130  ORF Transcript_113/g.130 Transcript_113/m.130 type:complete len:932 (-) Transcript_113:162-2957(-)|eukprot:CAMPEP_0114345940 /NCGR_PEP_ID=MMETSP0101-20121206/12668_1 /TAXON_ID=38822 ORGANISM="Pteridomonas danica, Strain PT" /NCGR_SAMPLE_ID=MMETSP0101 /ASSEMBLY_ACC=CAM_ASM_000211 /LENGTH=931 /DNA_ID=CAMNT_0001482283 /DNA_START=27 /DNA_END=2822 /DNA_ORIENTATION=+